MKKKISRKYIKAKYIKQIDDTHEWKKKTAEKSHAWKESGVSILGRRLVEVGTLWPGNDKNNIINDKIFFVIFSK